MRLLVSTCALIALGSAGFGGYVALQPRGISAVAADLADDPHCATASRHWPSTVFGHARGAVRGEPRAVAAWAAPPIIARCGMTSPETTTAECISVDGIDWVGYRLDDGMAFVTYGRVPAIEVLVPQEYRPEPLVLGAFAGAAQQLPHNGRSCR